MRDNYYTISAVAVVELKVERSRFIATCCPVDCRATAEAEYDRLRKQHHDATHNCFAYLVGAEAEPLFRYSDDGEPAGTAGKQIYESVLTHDITNTLIVVTRYFGGIKLGTGGLSRAYRDATNAVLDHVTIVERFIMQVFRLEFAHDQVSPVMKVLSDFGLRPTETHYGDNVEILGAIRRSVYDQFCAALIDRCRGNVEIEPLEVLT